MAAKMEKTQTPGIFKRGGRYVFSYRVDGQQRWESCARWQKPARRNQPGPPMLSVASFKSAPV
jgi:hypothetical protein